MIDFKLHYEDQDLKINKHNIFKTLMGRRKYMTKEITTSKPAKRNTRGTIETLKTIAITILVTAIIAFIAGMHFEANRNSEMSAAVKAAQTTATVKK